MTSMSAVVGILSMQHCVSICECVNVIFTTAVDHGISSFEHGYYPKECFSLVLFPVLKVLVVSYWDFVGSCQSICICAKELSARLRSLDKSAM